LVRTPATNVLEAAVENFLFVGVGRRACELVAAAASSARPLQCFHYADDAADDTPSVYLSSDFIRKMNRERRVRPQ